jgi:plastocyanin domain-containing protein
MLKTSFTSIIAVCLLGLAQGCGSSPSQAQSGTIVMSVTDQGFEPTDIKLKKGAPVTLLITRKTDETCAKEIVIDEYNIHTKLPLNQAVAVSFTPNKSGKLHYGCGMNKMVGGVLSID